MSVRIAAVMRTVIAALLALLGTMGSGCVQHPASMIGGIRVYLG